MRLELATTLGWLAEAEETLGLLDKSIASHQAKLAALAPNEPQGPQDRNAEHLRAATASALSRLYLDAGRPADALLSAQQARDSYAKLANLDPDNLNALARLAFARQQLSEVWLAQGEAKTAQLELARLGPELQRLLHSDAPKPAWRLKLRARWLSAMLASAAAPAERSARLLALTEFLDGVAAKARPDELDADTAWTLASAMLARGDALAPDDAALAQVQWQGALAALAPIGNLTEARVIYLRALALSRLKRTEEALALTEKLGASAYRHPLRPELKPGLQSGAIRASDKGAPPALREKLQ